MSSRSLNKVQLIGNLTRDPELRFTPQGTAVCTIGLATNRSWTTEGGEKREETEFHRIVAWNKLAELCSQLLSKGRKVYVEGRLQTRNWNAQDGTQHTTTEVVIEDMILLDARRPVDGFAPVVGAATATTTVVSSTNPTPAASEPSAKKAPEASDKVADTSEAKKPDEETDKKNEVKEKTENTEDINPDDIPF